LHRLAEGTAARLGRTSRPGLLRLLAELVDGIVVHWWSQSVASKALDDVAEQEYLTANIFLACLGRSELLRYVFSDCGRTSHKSKRTFIRCVSQEAATARLYAIARQAQCLSFGH
jgi:hypothetical protein